MGVTMPLGFQAFSPHVDMYYYLAEEGSSKDAVSVVPVR